MGYWGRYATLLLLDELITLKYHYELLIIRTDVILSSALFVGDSLHAVEPEVEVGDVRWGSLFECTRREYRGRMKVTLFNLEEWAVVLVEGPITELLVTVVCIVCCLNGLVYRLPCRLHPLKLARRQLLGSFSLWVIFSIHGARVY